VRISKNTAPSPLGPSSGAKRRSEEPEEWTESPPEDNCDSNERIKSATTTSLDKYIDDVFDPVHAGLESSPSMATDGDESSKPIAEQLRSLGQLLAPSMRPAFEDEELNAVAGDTDTLTTTNELRGYEPDTRRPLLHSVSFYRRLQRERAAGKTASTGGTGSSVVRVAVSTSGHSATQSTSTPLSPSELQQEAEQRMRTINAAVNIQQEHIAQASRALTLCRSSAEFRGSREEVRVRLHHQRYAKCV
jgi:hypothetical protein